ncbi:hypothetical protein A33M_1971 [Rhodovulum sp. PH10]|uniref:hypothetical protein n=1 Tax=Rhodovulum sp. PH10 TaxID=1187851 RepID=UPI00027C2707|nr:hypothetical protein [Rhodovulum sp. PH10]EJW13647.1 hypothetical protein A33M_1971 [Rhodovulum sp. PH10]
MKNASLATADRITHLKVVVLALVASIAIMVIGITAHATDDTRGYGIASVPVKASPILMMSSDELRVVR